MSVEKVRFRAKKIYNAACVSILIITAAFAVLTVAFSFGVDVKWSGAFVKILLVAGGIINVSALFFRKARGISFSSVGYYAAHLGIVVILAGFAVFDLCGDSVLAMAPIGGDAYYSNIRREDGGTCSLPFNFRVNSFDVEKYADGTDKQYFAEIEFIDAVSLKTDKVKIAVNKTARRDGWKIYLMSYAQDNVALMFRYDPGEYTVKAGIWLTTLGTVSSLILANVVKNKKTEKTPKEEKAS